MSGNLVSPPSTSTSPKLVSGSKPPPAQYGLDGLLPPPAVSGSLTQALRALNMNPHAVAHPLPDRAYDSPYSRSVTSTAPTSPHL